VRGYNIPLEGANTPPKVDTCCNCLCFGSCLMHTCTNSSSSTEKRVTRVTSGGNLPKHASIDNQSIISNNHNKVEVCLRLVYILLHLGTTRTASLNILDNMPHRWICVCASWGARVSLAFPRLKSWTPGCAGIPSDWYLQSDGKIHVIFNAWNVYG